MNAHVTVEQLQRLLAEQLNASERQFVEAHVDTCAECQQTLDGLIDDASDHGDVDWRLLGRGQPETTSEAMADFLRRLQERPQSLPEDPDTPEEPLECAFHFPEPPSDRGPLGRLESYHVVAEVGHGASGHVFKVYDEELDRLVALKVLKPELAASTSDRARFEREARAAAAVRHDHVVTIHRVGHTPGFPLPYLVMEYLDGEALSARLERGEVLPPRAAAELARQVALGLAAAHARGLVHRDIKPSNIMLEASTGRAKITDFGLARQVKLGPHKITQSGAIVGTPPYMSPEQIVTPLHVDGRSDLYSLGVVLYEVLTGETPFRGQRLQILQQVVTDEPLPPSRLRKVPRNLETITLKCLAKEPARRYQTAEDLADDLHRFLSGETILARPPTYVERLWRWCRRNPAWATAYLLAVTMLAALIAVPTVWAFREHQHAQDIEQALSKAQYQLAVNYLAEGSRLCEQGDGGVGVLKMAQALKTARADAHDLDRVIRANLANWFGSLSTLKACLPHEDQVLAVAISPDGQTLLTGSADNTARLWNASTGDLLHVLPHPDKVYAVAFHPDGKVILTGSGDGTARLWEPTTGKTIDTSFHHDGAIRAAAFSPDGQTVLTGSADKTARLWRVATGEGIGLPLRHKAAVLAVAFRPDGQLVITGSGKADHGGTAQLWEVGTGKAVGPCVDYPVPISVVSFGADGHTFWTIGESAASAKLWATATGERLAQPIQLQKRLLIAAFSSDGQTILTGAHDKTARLWQASTGKPLGQPLLHAGAVQAVAFSRDGNTILTGSKDGTARLWQAASGKTHGVFLKHGRAVEGLACSEDGKMVLTGSWDGTAQVWEVATGKRLGPPFHHSAAISSVALSPDGGRAVTGSYDHTAQVWDVRSGNRLGLPMQHHHSVLSVAFSPNGKSVLTGSADQTACLWEAETGKLLGQPLRHDDGVVAAVFSPRGDKLLTASSDGTAQFWDTASCTPIGPRLRHGHSVLTAAFGPDGREVATGSRGGSV